MMKMQSFLHFLQDFVMVKYWRWLEGNVDCVLKAACQQYVPTNKNGKLNLVMTRLCIYIIVVPIKR